MRLNDFEEIMANAEEDIQKIASAFGDVDYFKSSAIEAYGEDHSHLANQLRERFVNCNSFSEVHNVLIDVCG